MRAALSASVRPFGFDAQDEADRAAGIPLRAGVTLPLVLPKRPATPAALVSRKDASMTTPGDGAERRPYSGGLREASQDAPDSTPWDPSRSSAA